MPSEVNIMGPRIGFRWVGVAATVFAVFAAAVGYGVGHRRGRGATCFEVAVNTRDPDGRSLRSALLSREGATSDYTFWGTQCTITIVYPASGGRSGGHWRYDVGNARLYADDDEALAVFPASGRWRP